MLGELAADPQSLYSRAVYNGVKNTAPVPFDIDISQSNKLYLIVQDALSTAPDKATPVWAQAELVGPKGSTPLSALKPIDDSGLRQGSGADAAALRVKLNSVLVYDIAGKGYTRLRGMPDLEGTPLIQGETVQTRFFVFDRQPNMDRLAPVDPTTPIPSGSVLKTSAEAEDRVFRYALGRAPSPEERQIADSALGQHSADDLADLLWAVLMKPEFQLIY
jgi:hypothetical protein